MFLWGIGGYFVGEIVIQSDWCSMSGVSKRGAWWFWSMLFIFAPQIFDKSCVSQIWLESMYNLLNWMVQYGSTTWQLSELLIFLPNTQPVFPLFLLACEIPMCFPTLHPHKCVCVSPFQPSPPSRVGVWNRPFCRLTEVLKQWRRIRRYVSVQNVRSWWNPRCFHARLRKSPGGGSGTWINFLWRQVRMDQWWMDQWVSISPTDLNGSKTPING